MPIVIVCGNIEAKASSRTTLWARRNEDYCLPYISRQCEIILLNFFLTFLIVASKKMIPAGGSSSIASIAGLCAMYVNLNVSRAL